MQVRLSKLGIYICGVLFSACFVQACEGRGTPGPFVEIMSADPFASPVWSGDTVSIFGVHVGQSRTDAMKGVASRGERLLDDDGRSGIDCKSESCTITWKKSVQFSGVSVFFGKDNTVDRMILSSIQYILDDDVKARYNHRFHGSLKALLSDYSLHAQKAVLGEPSATIDTQTDKFTKFTDYHFANRGLRLEVYRYLDKSESISDLIFMFCKPDATAKTACGED